LRVRHGREVRFTALADGANASVLLFAADDPVDRLNIPDTLKAQMSACIHPPMVLMSDRGLALASVTGSSLDWHDALGGHSTEVHMARFGPSSYQADRNERKLSARTGLLSELRKHGRDRTDLHATVNLFSKVSIAADGALSLVQHHSVAGDWVTLRADLDLLLVMSTAPHALATTWDPSAVRVAVADAPPDDAPRQFRNESARALEQSALVTA
jgi:uncharacterized protein YcgI (DUF1989 family)